MLILLPKRNTYIFFLPLKHVSKHSNVNSVRNIFPQQQQEVLLLNESDVQSYDVARTSRPVMLSTRGIMLKVKYEFNYEYIYVQVFMAKKMLQHGM